MHVIMGPFPRVNVASFPRAMNSTSSPAYCAPNAPSTGASVRVFPSNVSSALPLSMRALKLRPSGHA